MKFQQEPQLEVGISIGSTLDFETFGSFECEGNILESSSRTATLANNQICIGSIRGKSLAIKPLHGATFTIKNVTIGIDFHWEQQEDQTFEGGLRLIIEDNKIRAINIVPLERYLQSVISSEMSAMNDLTLLKVHAIVSRSWLLAQLSQKDKENNITKNQGQKYSNDEIIKWYDREDHSNFDVCADDHCQRYQGITKVISENAKKATEETSGVVITYNESICDARFSKCCGGYSEDFQNVWQPTQLDYLSSVRDADNGSLEINDEFYTNDSPSFCNTKDPAILKQVLVDFDQNTTDFYRWKISYTQEEISNIINKRSGIDFGKIIELIPIERGKSGRITKLKIVGSKKTITVGKELEIRKWLSESHLYSSAFIVNKQFQKEKNVPSEFILHGAGWGHGVGMCQIGAAVMSQKGYDLETILKHYFNNSTLKKIY